MAKISVHDATPYDHTSLVVKMVAEYRVPKTERNIDCKGALALLSGFVECSQSQKRLSAQPPRY